MGTSFRYVCLTHDPQLESDADVHGHGSVTNSDRVKEMRALWKFVTGQRSMWSGPSEYIHLESWLMEHRRCKVGVMDGYGGMVELGQGRIPKADTGSWLSISLPRGWWASVVEAVRSTGPEFSVLADDLDNALKGQPYATVVRSAKPAETDPLDAAELEYLGEVQPGKSYLLRAKDKLSPEMADRMSSRLKELFPDSVFGIMTSNLEPVAPTAVVTDQGLLDAVRRAQGHADKQQLRMFDKPSKLAWAGASMALSRLQIELARDRDGSGTPPAGETPAAATAAPAAESATVIPDPSLPTKLVCTCQQIDVSESLVEPKYVPGLRDPFCDFHGYRDRELASIGLCGWKHPLYRGMRCTMRAEQYHMIHEQNDVFGTMSWDPKMAANGPGVTAYVKDWPEWIGRAAT